MVVEKSSMAAAVATAEKAAMAAMRIGSLAGCCEQG
jgi:hypothetical protein